MHCSPDTVTQIISSQIAPNKKLGCPTWEVILAEYKYVLNDEVPVCLKFLSKTIIIFFDDHP